MTERLHFHFSLSCTGEGNGNPLQCSCLENPRDREACGLLSMGSHRVGHNWSDLAAAAAAAAAWPVAHQAILSIGFPRWVAVSFSGDLPNPRIEPVSCIGRWVLYHQATWEAHTPWITYAFIPDLLVPGWNHSIYSHLNLTSLAPTYLHCIGFSQALLY